MHAGQLRRTDGPIGQAVLAEPHNARRAPYADRATAVP